MYLQPKYISNAFLILFDAIIKIKIIQCKQWYYFQWCILNNYVTVNH